MIPINTSVSSVRTIPEWRAYGKTIGLRTSWRNAARHYAKAYGKAIVHHADDSATIFAADDSLQSGVSCHHFLSCDILWHDGSKRFADIDAMASTREKSHYLVAGDKLWNGAIVSHCMAMAYNRLSDKIANFEREGKRPPENLLNGRHNLIANIYAG